MSKANQCDIGYSPQRKRAIAVLSALGKQLILLISFFCLSFVVAAESFENDRVKALAVETVILQLSTSSKFQFAGYYAAKEQGYYAEEGLKVEIQNSAQQLDVAQHVSSNKAHYGVGGVELLFNDMNGESIKALAAIFQHDPHVFVSKESSQIVEPADMIGKRIMLGNFKSSEAQLTALLASSNQSDQHYIPVEYTDKMDNFLAGNIDIISVDIHQLFKLLTHGLYVNIISPKDYGIDFYGDILFSNHQETTAHPERVKKFLNATKRGWEYALAHQAELVALIKKKYQSPLSVEQLRYEAKILHKFIDPDSISAGQIDKTRLRHIVDTYSRLKLSKNFTNNEIDGFVFQDDNKRGLSLTWQEKTWLKYHPVIHLGIARDFMPYQGINEHGEFEGIAADYIKILEQRLNVKFEITSKKLSWIETLEATQQGDVDVLAGLVKTSNRETYLNFSEPYLDSSAVIVSRKSSGHTGTLAQLVGKRVAIQKGYYIQELLERDYPSIQLVLTDTIKGAVELVLDGKADAYIGDVIAVMHAVDQEGFLGLILAGSTPYQSRYSLATDKRKPLLASIMAKGLASISQGEREAIYEHWRALEFPVGLAKQSIIRYSAILLALFSLFMYWIYRLRKSETAFKESESKLRLILDNDPNCIKVIDAKGCIIQINPAGLRLLGVGYSASVMGQRADKFVIEKHREAFNMMNQRALKGGSCSLEYQVDAVDGGVRWVDSHSVLLGDHKHQKGAILIVANDITQRKKTEEDNKVTMLVYQNTSEAMMILDKDSLIVAINPAFCETTGYLFSDIKGTSPTHLLSNEKGVDLDSDMKLSINKDGSWKGEIWCRRKQGGVFPARIIIDTIFTDDFEVEHRVVLFSDIAEQKATEKLIWDQANFDSLTGLPNRSMLLDHLNQDIKNANRAEKQLAVVFLDLDHFKEVNDTLGHDMGDVLLCEAATRLKACVRESDTVARLGGDEFIIILANLDETHNIDRVALDIIQSLTLPFKLKDKRAYVSASLGISLYPGDARQADALIKHADQAMYLSKQRGRGCFSYFTRSMQEQAKYRMQLLNAIRWALAENQFELYYQPIIDLATGEIIKAEALIRWNHPIKGLVNPVDFIGIAEGSGLIVEIGDWVYKEAALQVKTWRDRFKKDLKVSINKSPVQFRAASDSNDWINYLKEINLEGDGIVIEITEALLMDSASNITHQLLQYKDAGMALSLDNFGTGFSALSYFNKFDIDYLKIDGSLIRKLSAGAEGVVLSEAIILMAQKLGLKVIAVGIETSEQRDLLMETGCAYGQGFLFSEPVPASEFEKLLKDKKLVSVMLEGIIH